MNQYYLMAQLPSLDGLSDAAPLPITPERLTQLCREFMGRRGQKTLDSATLLPDRTGGAAGNKLLDAWNTGERQLRLALGILRAEKMKKAFEASTVDIPARIWEVARAAVQQEDPMEAERYLDRWRMDFLETLRPSDYFSEDTVYYYSLKLQLLARMRSFDEETGKQAYGRIYDSILHGDRQEAQI